MIHYSDGWKNAPHVQPISRPAAPYLPATGAPTLNSLFTVYDWVTNDGYTNFATWVERAARQANKPDVIFGVQYRPQYY
jgi:hypothetical protein